MDLAVELQILKLLELKNLKKSKIHNFKQLKKMELFKKNQNKAERVARFIVSLFLIPAPFIICANSIYPIILSVLGGILLFNALIGTCYIYRFFGVNTCEIK